MDEEAVVVETEDFSVDTDSVVCVDIVVVEAVEEGLDSVVACLVVVTEDDEVDVDCIVDVIYVCGKRLDDIVAAGVEAVVEETVLVEVASSTSE